MEQPQVPYAAMGSHCQEHACGAAIFCCTRRGFSLVNSGFT